MAEECQKNEICLNNKQISMAKRIRFFKAVPDLHLEPSVECLLLQQGITVIGRFASVALPSA
jgi:hypothetical protein